MTDKCYSIDEENFNMTEFSEVIDQFDGDHLGKTYWEGDALPVKHSDVIWNGQVSHMLEGLDEQAHELIGEVYDYQYSEVSDSAKQEFKEFLFQWASKNVDLSRFYFVKNVVKKEISQKDLTQS